MLNKFIQQLRKKHQLNQDQVAAVLGVTRPTYLQIEQGNRDLTLSEAKILADYFNLGFDDFIQQKEKKININIKKSITKKSSISTVRISIPQEKANKFKQVLLYILKKIGGKPNVGMTVLYKILYFIDFDFYEKYEEQLIGATYIKNQHGPTPILFKKIIDEMLKNNEVEEIKSKFYQYPQTKYLINPAVQPQLNLLNGLEIEHIDYELQRLSDLTAKALSDLSHKDVPWIGAASGEAIDYEAVFYRTEATTVRQYD